MRILKRLALGAMALSAAAATAQELNESLYVEGEYIPDIIRMEKLHLLPTKASFDFKTTAPAYAFSGVPTSYSPDVFALPSQAWQGNRRQSTQRGYFDLGGGSYLNLAGSTGYRFLNTETSSAGVWLNHNSSSLFKPHWNEATDNYMRRRYDETLGLYGDFRTDKGELSASLFYHLGYFNYYGFHGYEDYNLGGKFPTQTLNDLQLKVDWRGIGSSLDYSLGAGVRYFGYRRMYVVGHDFINNSPGTRETDINLHAAVAKSLANPANSVGILFNGDLLLYSDTYVPTGGVLDVPEDDDYCNFSFTPYYQYSNSPVKATIGAQVDVTANAGVQGSRYSAIHIAPAASLEVASRGVGAFLHVKGGTKLNTLASAAQYDYYQQPLMSNTTPMFSPIDAAVGVNLGPWEGFSAGVEMDYAVTNNVLLGGNYMLRGMECNGDMIDLRGMRVLFKANYELSSIFSIGANAAYHNQREKRGYFNGYDRPRWIIDASATVNPVKNVAVSLNYQYRGVRRIYGMQLDTFTGDYNLASQRLGDLTMLGAGVRWMPVKNISIWGEANNLLGRRTEILPAQPREGVNFAVGFGVTF